MKLIDLLVRELPKRGGWPEHATCVAQDGDGLVMFADCPPSVVRQINGRWFMNSRRLNGNGSQGYELSEDHATSVITREQYEAALDAVWNGEGLPPVGCECEIKFIGDTPPAEWFSFKLIGMHDEIAIVKLDGENTWRHISKFSLDKVKFRPIRSEADKKRDAAIESIDWYMPEFIPDTPNELYHAKKIYDAIAAGKIPGVKLEG